MNWGYKILVVYLVFVGGILFLVFKSSSQKMDLVTTDYYAKELKYQEKIDQNSRVAALSAPLQCELKAGELSIVFPKDFSGKKIEGEAVLYYPADENRDISKAFATTNSTVSVPLKIENKGSYELHLNWTVDGVSYYFEKKIFI